MKIHQLYDVTQNFLDENEDLYIVVCIFRNIYSKETENTTIVIQINQNIILEHLTLKLG